MASDLRGCPRAPAAQGRRVPHHCAEGEQAEVGDGRGQDGDCGGVSEEVTREKREKEGLAPSGENGEKVVDHQEGSHRGDLLGSVLAPKSHERGARENQGKEERQDQGGVKY